MREVASVGDGALESARAFPDGRFPTDPGTAEVLRFDMMTPVTGPYLGSVNPVRGIPGGGLPWVLRSGTGSLSRDGRLLVRVRGLVLASRPAVPESLRNTNPFPAFRATVSCLSTDPRGKAIITNVSTGDFEADKSGNLSIDARVSLPQPCVAPIVMIIGPSGVECWLAVTGG